MRNEKLSILDQNRASRLSRRDSQSESAGVIIMTFFLWGNDSGMLKVTDRERKPTTTGKLRVVRRSQP